MLNNKLAYYQGTEKPTPKKKQYKSEPALVVQPRFKEPFYHNYDTYETEGVDGQAKHGPGTGLYQNMDKYDSIDDFRKSKEKLKDKYKADDSLIEDDGSISKIKKANKIARRMALMSLITKYSIDFPIDDQISSIIDENELSNNINPIGGMSGGMDIMTDDDKPYDFVSKDEFVE